MPAHIRCRPIAYGSSCANSTVPSLTRRQREEGYWGRSRRTQEADTRTAFGARKYRGAKERDHRDEVTLWETAVTADSNRPSRRRWRADSTQTQSDEYYSDDAPIFQNSPVLRPHMPKLEPLSTQPITSTNHTVSPESSPGTPKSNGPRMKVAPSLGDAVLVGALDGNRHPEIAAKAGEQPLPGEGDIDEEPIPGLLESPRGDFGTLLTRQRGGGLRGGGRVGTPGEAETEEMAVDPPEQAEMGAFNLKSLAASALQVTKAIADPPSEPRDTGPTSPPTEPVVVKEKHVPPPLSQRMVIRRGEPGKEERPPQPTGGVPSPYSPRSFYSPPGTAPLPPIGVGSPDTLPPSGGLPPIQLHSPRSDTNGQTPLPSIRDQLGDALKRDQLPGGENGRLRDARLSFGHSPPTNVPRLPPMAHPGHPGSPPISPADYRGQLSPGQSYQQVASPAYYGYHQENGLHRSPHYPSSATVTPGSDQSSTPATSINEKMSIEGLTIQSAVYTCKFQGCTAAPFQTQYLLNSHANVHSSARPHYCPVAGCPRSEGGKGFKRKNEMIRHGLVHDSPGYVCPFCPDREHKYPRPDNLQRHVRVHHVDKDKDDPMLRDVLAQRPDGPNKGRRRRGLGA